MNLNRVTLIGRLGKDPETKEVGSSKVSNFSIGTSERYKDKSGKLIENTEWHNITCWGKLAEIVESYFKKGMLVYIEGKLKTESYEKNGEKRNFTKVVADVVQMLESKKEGGKSETKEEYKNDPIEEQTDLPF